MKLVYVAGPYRAEAEFGVLENIRRAEKVALEVWRAGAACICPHKNTAFFGGAADDRVWLEGDLEIIRRCDAIVLVEGWQNSTGTLAEIKLASELGLPVFEWLDEFRDWLLAAELPAVYIPFQEAGDV